MGDKEQMVTDLLCGELQTSWSYCDSSCISCMFYHEESDMGARVSICAHGFGSSKESCSCYMTQHEYSEFVRFSFANLKAENAKLRELVRDLWLTGSLCDAIPDMRLQAKGGDWRTMQERVDEALGIEVDDD